MPESTGKSIMKATVVLWVRHDTGAHEGGGSRARGADQFETCIVAPLGIVAAFSGEEKERFYF